ncbi:FRG domain-containing protein [Capnocytophaga leadbetteri]|uniref:FRG domain-containing protein n=1 Tax=Capnocytophaga leadbetteri TaxID=327575 RepID=UPI0028E50445|nr:FRG domain-containing protein [Capnocytophaga leadbetteri]
MSDLEKKLKFKGEFIIENTKNSSSKKLDENTYYSLEGYISCIKEIYEREKQNDCKKHLFFRGQADASWSLTPKVLREKDYNEKELVLDFYHYGPLHSFNYDLDNDRLSLLTDMQHYEVPTRLLDWSLSPLSSLYFAVESSRNKSTLNRLLLELQSEVEPKCVKIDIDIKKDEIADKETDAVVYVLNPWIFNKQILDNNCRNYRSHPKIQDAYLLARALLSTYKDFGYIKKFVYDKYGFRITKKDIQEPFALVSNFTNSRMQHQRGVFTIHGMDKVDLRNEDYFTSNAYKIIIKAEVKQEIYEQLNWLYINEYTQYPDIKGIKEIVGNRQGFFNI